MALQKFDLATLTELDGARIRTAFDQAVERLVEDCKDRPNVKAKRTLALSVSLVPIPDDDGELSSIDVDFAMKETAPKRESRTYNMLPARKGLLFNEVSPDEVKQRTLDEVGKPRAVKPAAADAQEVADAV